MSTAYTDRILALAGLFQAARLAQQLAREGRAEPSTLAASVQSLLIIDAPTTESVYGGAQGVRPGLELLRDKLAGGNTDANDVEIARYVISMIHLEGQMRRHPEMQDAVRRGIEATREQMKFFEAAENSETLHPRLVEKLAELYTQTISTLTPRIMVNGEHGHLSNPLIAARVRAALFAGIRSAFLWHQLGGSRWQLLFSRKKIAGEAAGILESLGAAREN
ncbi:lysogenization protein HflD [Sulfuricaulis limicola]|uniref:High frequency lysogenization protein HflD homolog n=1 Tax=Sulfuricaulis limicola TaxID=1620215 RepID=A0A1B4XCJ8_9GAMM|nr:high frequency lysogenization protein HflD [Sulfuricaulis limicola]BAV32544.1 lysogenization protein HflD [Sulfuricaulis limicola]